MPQIRICHLPWAHNLFTISGKTCFVFSCLHGLSDPTYEHHGDQRLRLALLYSAGDMFSCQCPNQTRCSMPAPWGKFFRAKKRWAAAVVNSDKQKHVFKSISIICNQSCWNNSIFSGHWAQLLNTLATDFCSEVIKPKMVQAEWSQQGEPTTQFGSLSGGQLGSSTCLVSFF